MTTLKTLKDGKVALVFDAEQVVVAAQIFSMIVGGDIPSLTSKAKRTLSDVATTITSSGVAMRLNTPVAVAKEVVGLDAEKLANEICSIVFDKQVKTFGQIAPARFRTFYTELELDLGIPLAKKYREVIGKRNVDKSKYPYRKIDIALQLAPAEKIHDFAKRFEFVTV